MIAAETGDVVCTVAVGDEAGNSIDAPAARARAAESDDVAVFHLEHGPAALARRPR